MDFPPQVGTGVSRTGRGVAAVADRYDMREHLNPRRATILMWDQAFLLRHHEGGSFADYDRVLDETIERGYNTVRLDPMPQYLDLSKPETVMPWRDTGDRFNPWGGNKQIDAPLGQWLIDFMAALSRRPLYYTLSAWWNSNGGPQLRSKPENHIQAAEIWINFLHAWEKRFGFDRLLYVDIQNEVPFFIPGYRDRFTKETGHGWDDLPSFSDAQRDWLARDLNGSMRMLHREFPQLRFTASIHGDVRWIDVPLEFDCLDVHFYSDADLRWRERTKMHDHFGHMYSDDSWFKDYSDRCTAANACMGPMFRARQRDKLAQFAAWSRQRGMPLTTSESWSSWFYVDHPNLDWGWLLEWSAWTVEDAIDFNMWGWTPHNFGQPQFTNWQDVQWHQRLTERFLRS